MSINKVIYGDSTLIDLTSDSVTAGALMSGVTAHDSSGALVTGTIAAKTSADIAVAGPTVTVPSGYYGSSVSTSVASGSAKVNGVVAVQNPTISFDSNTGIFSAINRSGFAVSGTVTSGYITSITSGNVTVNGSATYQLSTKSSSDITVSGPTVAVPSGYYTTNNSITIQSADLYTGMVINPEPDITVSSTGLITAAVDTQSTEEMIRLRPGYVSSVPIFFRAQGSSTYQLPTKSSSDITVAGSNVSVPSGYYAANNNVTIPQASINSSFVWRVDPSIGFNSTTGVVTADFDQEMQGFLVTQSGYADEMTIYLNPYGVSSYQIPVSSASDITVAGPTVTIPSGYYAGVVSKSVASGSLNEYINLPSITPSWSIDSSTGKVTAEYFVAPGISPIATSGYFENDVYVYPIISLNSSYQLSTKSAATYTPSTAAQTIASGQYLTGAQTVKGDANLIAANIASGVTIFGITGTHQGGITPTGTISITSNGTYDVTNYASASVNIGAVVSGSRLIIPEGMIGV